MSKSIYLCDECGYESSGWLGRCPNCQAWNSFKEFKEPKAAKKNNKNPQSWLEDLMTEETATRSQEAKSLSLADIDSHEAKHFSSGITELDRVLGGGFVPASLVLLGGDPGVGKSTLLLQALSQAENKGAKLYVCGEESPQQVKRRAQRLGLADNKILLSTEVEFTKLARQITELKPGLCVIDSIQTIYSAEVTAAAGSVSQVRDCAQGFLRLAKSLGICIILVGHVTKDGQIAGPRILEHMVDTVLYFEGELYSSLRLIRAVKNRFGSNNELGLFEMSERGLSPVAKSAQTLLAGRPEAVAGSALSCVVEGTRPLIIEIQALLNPSAYNTATRVAQGLDRNRINMLLALLEKQLALELSHMDCFINVVSGLKTQDPATDLALLAAIYSSHLEQPLREKMLLCGEVGLTGELRPVSLVNERLKEASSFDFKSIILPGASKRQVQTTKQIAKLEIFYADHIKEALDICW